MRVLMEYLGVLAIIIYCTSLSASNDSLWLDSPDISARVDTESATNEGIQQARKLSLNTEAMKSLLLNVDDLESNIARKSTESISISLPLPSGKNVFVDLEPTDLLPEALSNKYPSIRTYKVTNTTSNILSGRVDYTTKGFHAMLLTKEGETIFIDPEDNDGGNEYLSFRKSDQHNHKPFQCSTPEAHDHSSLPELQSRTELAARNAGGTIEYRVAIAATAEYTIRQGGTVASALSAIVTTLNRVNQVYEHSLGVRLSLVENNDKIIYTQSSTDPYSNFDIEAMLSENQNNIDQVIGSNNYDIGHVFGSSGGGLAYISSLCTNGRKAMAASGLNSPYGDSFDIDFVSHELGHQLGATHTFNGTLGICTASARTARSAFEPGSGSSIMSYAGGCGTDNLQSASDAMFHSGNIQQIQQNVLLGAGSSCGIQHASTNQAPVVSTGDNFVIPANTPFQLTAEATDPDNDSLLYSWEQYDSGTATTLRVDTGDNPLFRIFKPSESNTRTFPSLKMLTGQTYISGEMLPQKDRTMKFQVAVYDNNNSPSIAQTEVSVVNTGSIFSLTSELTAYTKESYANIQWDTANTHSAPINCSSVDLYLSIDNGDNFDYQLAQKINNSGSASIYIPDYIPNSSAARFKLSCSSGIFFNISPRSFTIGQTEELPLETPRSTETNNFGEISPTSGGGSIGYFFIGLMFLRFLAKKKQTE